MKVSVIIPLYNKEAYIRRTLDSILAQTMTDFEVVVINDGSTDRSAEIVAGYDDPRIRLITQQNAGEGRTRERGMQEARGDYFAFIDADDDWAPRYLEVATQMAEYYPQAGAIGVKYAMIDPDGTVTPAQLSPPATESWCGLLPNFFACALAAPPLWSSCTLIPRTVIEELQPKASPAKIGADQYLFCQIALKYPIAYNSAILAYYHREADGRVLNTYAYDGELPFVTLLIDEIKSGRVPPEDVRHMKAFIARYQMESLWRIRDLPQYRAAGRQLLARTPLLYDNRREWYWYWTIFYLPTWMRSGSYHIRAMVVEAIKAPLRPCWRLFKRYVLKRKPVG